MLDTAISVMKLQFIAPKALLDLPRISAIEVTAVKKYIDRTIIELDFQGHHSSIVLKGNQIIWQDGAYNDLTGHIPNLGTDSIGLLAVGSLGIVASTPLLFANSLFWMASRKLFGMNRHALSIWCRLRGQLDHDTQERLFKCLIQL